MLIRRVFNKGCMDLPVNILIIDDERGSRESLRMILKHSYNVFTASDGKEALEIIRQVPIDLVTLDLRMPAMNGSDVLREIRSLNPNMDVVIVTGYGTLKSATEAIRYGVFDYILKPFNVADIMSVVKRSIEKRHFDKKQKDIIRDLGKICAVEGGDRQAEGEAGDDEDMFLSIEKVISRSAQDFRDETASVDYLEFVRVLGSTLESNDPYTHGHSDRVHHYAIVLAHHLGFGARQAEEIQIAAFLHDIGKIGVGNTCIQKNGKLTEQEKALVREHPEKALELVGPLRLAPSILTIIKHHHERFDGKGYPAGLTGEQIPLSARIISIADAYDAMTSDRPYRKALPHEVVMQELLDGRSKQFDPSLVNSFVSLVRSDDFLPPSRSTSLI